MTVALVSVNLGNKVTLQLLESELSQLNYNSYQSLIFHQDRINTLAHGYQLLSTRWLSSSIEDRLSPYTEVYLEFNSKESSSEQ